MSVSISQTVSQHVPSSELRLATVAKHAAIGGAVGAVAAAGLSFIGPIPIIGGMFAPIAAALGGVAGLVIGGIVGLLRSRSSKDDAKVGAGVVQAPPPPTSGVGSMPPPPPSLP